MCKIQCEEEKEDTPTAQMFLAGLKTSTSDGDDAKTELAGGGSSRRLVRNGSALQQLSFAPRAPLWNDGNLATANF